MLPLSAFWKHKYVLDAPAGAIQTENRQTQKNIRSKASYILNDVTSSQTGNAPNNMIYIIIDSEEVGCS